MLCPRFHFYINLFLVYFLVGCQSNKKATKKKIVLGDTHVTIASKNWLSIDLFSYILPSRLKLLCNNRNDGKSS